MSSHTADMLGGLLQDTVDSAGHKVDPEFYATFWGLQAMCQAPFEVINPERWVQVCMLSHQPHPACHSCLLLLP